MTSLWAAQWASGVLCMEGRDRIDLLHRLSTQDLRPLAESGRTRSTLLTTNQGKLVDWLRVVAAPEAAWLLTAPGRAGQVKTWIEQFIIMEDAALRDVDDWHHVVLQGQDAAQAMGLAAWPEALRAVAHRGGWWWRGLAAYGWRLEALLPASEVAAVLAVARQAGASEPAPSDWERLRIAGGVPGPEGEYPEPVLPLPLRLAAEAVSFSKGCYIGQEVISRLDSYDKVGRYLMGWRSAEPLPPDAPLKVVHQTGSDSQAVGKVTSCIDAGDGGSIGLAIIDRRAAVPGPVQLVGAGHPVAAALEDRAFWAPDSAAALGGAGLA